MSDFAYKVINFDLSTTCIGVLVVGLDSNNKISLMKSCPIIPVKFCASRLGFMKSKKKLPTKEGGHEKVNTWWIKGEKSVSKALKKQRDIKVREAQNNFYLTNLSSSMAKIIEGINPDVINVEKNAMFNGILTIELLAKLMGTLIGIAARNNIPLNEYKVPVVRKKHKPAKLVQQFARNHSSDYIASLPDVTKAALRDKMQKKYGKYGLVMQTDDEGDACVVFDYWYEDVYLPSL